MSQARSAAWGQSGDRGLIKGLAVVGVALIVLDLAARVVWLASYGSPNVFPVWDAILLGGFATFPAILLPALLIVPRRSAAPPPSVLAGAFVLAAAELVFAVGLALEASPSPAWNSLMATVFPEAAWLLLALGWIGLARALSGLWTVAPGRVARWLAGLLLLGPVVLTLGVVTVRFGFPATWLLFFEEVGLLPFAAAWLAWVGLLAWSADRRRAERQLAAIAGVLIFVATLLPAIYLESGIVGLRWGGNLRWEVSYVILGLGMIALDVALTRAARRAWVA